MFENFKIISAGAGSGKTFRLTAELVGLLASGEVRPSGIIATTFTRKAAAELQERLRVKLLSANMPAEADALSNSLIGTVHGLGLKLLRRFAFEAGVSPLVDILPEGDEQLIFNQSLSASLSMELIEEMDLLCDRLGYNAKPASFDWRRELRSIADLARANDISLEGLADSCQKSAAAYRQLLPPVDPSLTIESAHRRLAALLRETIEALTDSKDSTKKSADVVSTLRALLREYELRQELFWHQWARIAKLEPSVKSADLIADLVAFANRHEEMEAFQGDVFRFAELLFQMAIDALREYAAYKHRRGLIDYTDMEVLVNRLLDQQEVSLVLADELDLLMVDEFQDTSPIQLSIFLKLSRLAKNSIWVGDPKQSIYGFRGAEPALMQAIVEATGGIRPENIQTDSWRSRTDLVLAANAIFTKAFAQLPAEQVALNPRRQDAAGPGRALMHWHFTKEDGGKRAPAAAWTYERIAQAVSDWLAEGPLVEDRNSKVLRRALPGDVAILCRNNSNCEKMAAALHKAGLQAALPRKGLLSTPEACLVLACLKYLLNEEDSLSNAEIQLLAARKPLQEIVNDRLSYLEKVEGQGRYPSLRWGEEDPFIGRLNALRPLTGQLSSAELLHRVWKDLALEQIVLGWGQASQRLANVDQLRRLALDYEVSCNQMQSAASLGGFLLWLGQRARRAEDAQGAGESPQAVNVLTYHKSKGLEWPAVIACDLESALKAEVWGLELITENETPQLDNILANRWIRYWAFPYESTMRATPLQQRVDESHWKALKKKQALEEEARLLYVGLTRARDYQIFPTSTADTKWFNRVFNQGDETIPVLDPLTDETPWDWAGNFLSKHTKTWVVGEGETTAATLPAEQPFFPEKGSGSKSYDEYRMDPEVCAEKYGRTFYAGQAVAYGKPLGAVPSVDIGVWLRLINQWLIADDVLLEESERTALANAMIDRYRLLSAEPPPPEIDAAALCLLSLQWQQWLGAQKALSVERRLPLAYPKDGQLFTAVIDWVVTLPEGRMIILDAAFAAEQTEQHARDWGAWLSLAGEALQAASPGKIIGYRVHFPWRASVVEVRAGTAN